MDYREKEKNMKLSLIVIVNNFESYNKYLIESLKRQTYNEYELIMIDNTKQQYRNAVEAYNYGISRSTGDYLCFLHQDICFLSESSLENICVWILKLDKMRNIGVMGVAGASAGRNSQIYSSIVHGSEAVRCGDIYVKSEKIVQTLDECLFIISKKKMMQYGFDKNIKGFHLYCVEYCLRMTKYKELCVVIPAEVWHISSGASLDWTYYRELKKIVNKYRDVKYINTTVHCWENSFILPLIVWCYMARNYIHHNLLRNIHACKKL